MKKLAVLVLLLVYSVSVSGAAFHLHFCGSYLQSVSFAGSEHATCCCGKKVMDTNCCQDKEVVFKTKDSVYQSTSICATPKVEVTLPAIFHEPPFVRFNFMLRNNAEAYHSPPIRTSNSERLVLNCVFRI